MERKIGEIFKYDGEWYQCVEQPEKYDKMVCDLCAFQGNGNCELDRCSGTYRSDKKFVIFKKLEKVGEPYTNGCKLFQRYKLFTPTNELVNLEIKQNKEDMEEKNQDIIEFQGKKYKFIPTEINKDCSDNCAFMHAGCKECDYIPCTPEERNDGKRGYFVELFSEEIVETPVDEVKRNIENQAKNNIEISKLKPFNFEAAKAGKPVCTRDGRKVRIICFDRITCDDYSKIVACVTTYDGKDEYVLTYGIDGYILNSQHPQDEDLMMLPEKKEGWVNVYDADTTFRFVEGMVYNTKDEAIQRAKEEVTNGQREKNEYVDTVKICWEE